MAFNIGIDLGTTNSAMAVYDDETDTVQMIENFNGAYTTPSVVQILDDDVIVGQDAVTQRIRYPDRTLTRTKQYMGDEEKTWEIDGTEYPPERVAGYILQKLKEDAEESFDEDVDGAVVTVPYYFGSAARTATKNAAKFADLDVYKTMNEPTAACYAYGYEAGGDETLLVYDLGGGTFDATLMEVGENSIEAQTSHGDNQLGGENFDDELYEHVRQELLDQGADDPNEDRHSRVNLRGDVKEAKELLSNSEDAVVVYQADELYEVEITQEEFQEITANLVDKTIEIIEEMFEDSEYEISDVDNVLLVGGSTRNPHVRDAVEEYFGIEPSTDTNPDEIVAKGAALEAAQYEGNIKTVPPVQDVLSHSLGVETYVESGPNEFDPILEKDEAIPYKESKPYGNPDDREQSLIVHVLQGEEDLADADGNESLGQFRLKNVPGDTKLNVEFFVKEDGTLDVSAEADEKDIEGGITIEDGIGLTESEFEEIEEDTQDYSSKAVQKQAGDD